MLKKTIILGGLGITMGFSGSDQTSFRSAVTDFFDAADLFIRTKANCYDTRDRQAYRWAFKGTTKSFEDAVSKCQGYDYMSVECPTNTGFQLFCVPTIPPRSAIIDDANCGGLTSSTPQLNYGSNGHCTGPYFQDGYALGGWHRGRLYAVPVSSCNPEARGDGRCDTVCNTAQYDWDNGDCCEHSCFDDSAKPYTCGFDGDGYDCKGNARPFWVFTHRANSVDLIKESIDSGANGIEFDVSNWYGGWEASHGESRGPKLTEYMDEFKKQVEPLPGYSALWVDNKDAQDSLARAQDLQRTVRASVPKGVTIMWAFPWDTPAKYINYFNDNTFKSTDEEGMSFWVSELEHVLSVEMLCKNLEIAKCTVDVGHGMDGWDHLLSVDQFAMIMAKVNAMNGSPYGIKNSFMWTVNDFNAVDYTKDASGVIIGSKWTEYSDSFDQHVQRWLNHQKTGHLANRYDRPWNYPFAASESEKQSLRSLYSLYKFW
jgi:hypothetical protein